MYDEVDPDGHQAHTVQHIAEEFGVTRPTIEVSHRVAVCPQPVQGGVEVDGIQQVGVVGVESQ